MQYHYSPSKYSSYYEDLGSLKSKMIDDMKEVIVDVKHKFPDTKVCFTRRNGLGYVFTDVSEDQLKDEGNGFYSNGFLIGKGESAIFQEIKDSWDYVFFTTDKVPWSKPDLVINNKKILMINITKLIDTLKAASSLQSVVRIFLRPEPMEDLETILRKLLVEAKDEDVRTIMKRLELLFYKFKIEENDDLQLIIRIISSLLDNLQVENPEILKKIPELPNISELIVKSHADFFNKKLHEFKLKFEEFKNMVDNNEREKQLQNHIKDYPWILDFKFFNYPKPEKEIELDIGNNKKGRIDLYFQKKQFNKDYITIVEFKKPDADTTGFIRNMATIMTPTIRGLSQLINYIEHKNGADTIVEGILVIGRDDEETGYFIDTFSKYLNRMIRIVTYDRLLQDTTQILSALTESGDSKKVNENIKL